jgi:hypothetical protein
MQAAVEHPGSAGLGLVDHPLDVLHHLDEDLPRGHGAVRLVDAEQVLLHGFSPYLSSAGLPLMI